MENSTAARRIAITLLRIAIRGGNDIRNMRELGACLGYAVAAELAALGSTHEWPLTTIVRALSTRFGATVIVPNLHHLDGIGATVRLIAPIITVEDDRVLERAQHRLVDTSAAKA
ncbi:hypothetical protein [Nocardia miyunensis]|uniref:hypothetical protein n=1 Tax=Nocardia miyunensis TaxID=282684 RepID=UPI000B21E1FE|nr:hypothetical protein [Nocardia miyunensis]